MSRILYTRRLVRQIVAEPQLSVCEAVYADGTALKESPCRVSLPSLEAA